MRMRKMRGRPLKHYKIMVTSYSLGEVTVPSVRDDAARFVQGWGFRR